MAEPVWPALPLDDWKDTYATLHMWMQIVGKIKLMQTPRVNHWWNVAQYVSARGLTTSAIPYNGRTFQMDFDFIDQQLRIECDDGRTDALPLRPCSVAEFYAELMDRMQKLGLGVKIWPVPVEIENPIPFEKDDENASYDGEYARRCWRILAESQKVFTEFRSRFIGKCSPVHFFWGSFDMAVTRFSGRGAPERPGADLITREAYSHEVISHGFWPGMRGSGDIHAPAFYAYAAPEPEGMAQAKILPSEAFYSPTMKEFFLLYDDVRNAESPEEKLMSFLQSTYDAAANLAKWDRAALERH
jgi:hypothetical protein